MSILDGFSGMTGEELEEYFKRLDEAFDEYFGDVGERRRFMNACRRLSYKDVNIIQNFMHRTQVTSDYLKLANEVENPLRTADAILMLEKELETTKDSSFMHFLLNLLQRDKVATALYRARYFDWEGPLLENKNLPTEFIEFIWNLNKHSRYKDYERYETPRIISKHPNCPEVVLEELYKNDDLVIRKAIARHRNINESLTNKILNSSRLEEREQIAKSKYVPKEVLLSLMWDKYERVSNAAKKQFQKRFKKERITDDAIDKAIKYRIKKPYVKPERPEKKFNVYADSRMGIDHIKSLNPSQRASVAKHADKEIIEALACDNSKAVRRSVAASYWCPDEVLTDYLTESDPIIGNNALLTIFSRRPEAVIEDLLDKESIGYSYSLLNNYLNEKANFKPGIEKSDLKTEAQIERIYIVAQYSKNPMIQNRIIGNLARIPESFTIHWKLLSKLSDSLHLMDSVIRKISIELNFSTENVLLNCKNKALVLEYLSLGRVHGGIRKRLEEHVETLQDQ